MTNLFKNPLVIGGALIGAYWIFKKKPESKVGRTIGRVREYAEDVVDTAVDTGTELVGGLYETGVDIWGIYDNDDVPDIDEVGVEGADASMGEMGDAEEVEPDDTGEEAGEEASEETGTGEDDENTDPDGGGFDGGTSRMSRGFDGATMNYNMEF